MTGWLYRRNPEAAPSSQPTPFPTASESGPELYQVGFMESDGVFFVVRTQTTEQDAARIVHFLNGGAPGDYPPVPYV